MVIGKRGTDSAALWDHHALTVIPAGKDEPARIALPIRLHDGPAHGTGLSAYHGWSATGLWLFEVAAGDEPALTLRGRMIVQRAGSAGGKEAYGLDENRSVLVGDGVHFAHDGQVWSAPWNRPETLAGPR